MAKTNHLKGNVDLANEFYEKALEIKFTIDKLTPLENIKVLLQIANKKQEKLK